MVSGCAVQLSAPPSLPPLRRWLSLPLLLLLLLLFYDITPRCAGLLTHPQLSRLPSGRVLVRLRGWDQHWTVLVSPAPLPAPITWLSANGSQTEDDTSGQCLYQGRVLGRPGSRAALSLCRGVSGIISVNGKTIIVRPAPHVRRPRGPHVLKTLNVTKLLSQHLAKHRRRRALLSRATITLGEEEEEEEEETEEDEESSGDEGVLIGDQWFPSAGTKPADAYRLPPTPADLARPRWLELVVVADGSVVNFHGEQRVLDYILTMLNVMSAVLEDNSLQARLQIVVSKVYLLDDASGVVRRGAPLQSLRAVNRWASRLSDPRDAVVWLTRRPLGGPSGYAPVSGACDPTRSTSLNRDQGLSSAFIVAHELGHLLGLTHDGDGDDCGWAPRMGSVMAPLISATYNRFLWSNCSRQEYISKISWWQCLYNRPDAPDSTLVSDSVDRPFSLREQCELEFGPGHKPCRAVSVQGQCDRLWCSPQNSARCFTRRSPPLDGTACGPGRWCVDGECRSVYQNQSPVGTGWSEWSPWGPCSRSCGAGVRRRRRECGSVTGRCVGHSAEVKLCSGLPRCWEDPRAAFCRWQGPAGSWQVTYSTRFPCHFWCVRTTDGRMQHGDLVPDGVSCGTGDPPAICVQGQCRELDCTGTRLLPPQADNCSGCSSDNRHRCRAERRLLTLVPVTPFSLVARLPVGARHMTITETVASPHRVALFIRKLGQYLINGLNGATAPGSYLGHGIKFTYEVRGNQEHVSIPGPLSQELDVQIQSSSFQSQIVLNITYFPVRQNENRARGVAAAHQTQTDASLSLN